jgi:2-iminobutanoate/2-iminopropanoate deaminase
MVCRGFNNGIGHTNNKEFSMDAHQIQSRPDSFEAFGIAQGYKVENTIYMSGQIGMTLEGDVVGVGDIEVQTKQAMENIKAILATEGVGMNQIVKITTYLTDMKNAGKYSAVKSSFFSAPYPAETLVQVSALAMPDLLVEIDVIALVDGVRRPSMP